MTFFIGKLIEKQLKETGMTKSEFARRINKSRQNVDHILKRKSVDTELLECISKVLSHDFFQYLSSLVAENRSAYARPRKPAEPRTYGELVTDMETFRKEFDLLKKENIYLKKINQLLEEKAGK